MVPFFQICAGAECSACAGEDAAEEGGFVVVPSEEGVKLVVPECIEAIEVFGSVEGYKEDRGVRKGDFGVEDGWRRSCECCLGHIGSRGSVEDEDGTRGARKGIFRKCWISEGLWHGIGDIPSRWEEHCVVVVLGESNQRG